MARRSNTSRIPACASTWPAPPGSTSIRIAYDGVFFRPQDFTGLTSVKSYPQPFWGIEGATSWLKQIDFSWFFVSGAGVNYNPSAGRIPLIAHEDQGNATLTIHASGRLRIDNTYLLEHIRERDAHLTAVTNHIFRSKWNWQFTRELSARVIFQYTGVLSNPLISSLSPTKNFNTDFLVTYLVHPGHGDLRGIQQQSPEPRPPPDPDSNRLAHYPE